jgi:hypothetical protein
MMFMCIYVCMYACIIYIRTYIHTHTHTYVNACDTLQGICLQVHVHMHVHRYGYVYVLHCIYVRIAYLQGADCVSICMYTFLHRHISYVCVCVSIHLYILIQSL